MAGQGDVYPVYLVNEKMSIAWFAGNLDVNAMLATGEVTPVRKADISEIGDDAMVIVLKDKAVKSLLIDDLFGFIKEWKRSAECKES